MKRITPLYLLLLPMFAGTVLAAGQSNLPTTGTKSTADHSQMDHGKMDHHAGHGEQAGNTAEFTALDRDKDGTLSKAELAKHKLFPHFDMLDVNRDGRLTSSEFDVGKGM